MHDLEEALSRELHQVADGLRVPALPALPREEPRAVRRWPTLLVAAAVVLVIAGLVVVLTSGRASRGPEPAPSPTPTPTPTATADIRTTPPTVPYVLGRKLYVEGQQVPGEWWMVRPGADGWVAQRVDYTWWWGTGPEANEIEGQEDTPVISPSGQYVGETRVQGSQGVLSGFEARYGAEGFGGVGIDLGSREEGSQVTVRAVTDDGWVIAQGTETAVMWQPLVDPSRLIDLTKTAPGLSVLAATPAGLLVSESQDGADGAYLAEISESGEINPTTAVPAHDDLLVSPGAAWEIWTDPGTTQGDVTSVPTLNAQSVNSRTQATLTAPDGWAFRVRTQVWENDDEFVSSLEGDGTDRMARCSVVSGECVLIDAP